MKPCSGRGVCSKTTEDEPKFGEVIFSTYTTMTIDGIIQGDVVNGLMDGTGKNLNINEAKSGAFNEQLIVG